MSRFEDPVIISCSISGAIANRDQCPAIPYTPEEYAEHRKEANRATELRDSANAVLARASQSITPELDPTGELLTFLGVAHVVVGNKDQAIVVLERIKARGAEFTMPPTDVTMSTIAVLKDTCGNLVQLTQLNR